MVYPNTSPSPNPNPDPNPNPNPNPNPDPNPNLNPGPYLLPFVLRVQVFSYGKVWKTEWEVECELAPAQVPPRIESNLIE